MDALRHEARTEGRYRLDPVDEHNRMIPNAPAAYVCIHASESPAAPPPTARPVSPSTDHAVIEAMRLNSELARSIVDKFPLMLESAAALVRAADGAGMPAREPRALPEPRKEVDDDDDDEEEEEEEDDDEMEVEETPPKAKASSWAGLLETLIPFVAPALMNALSSGKLQLPGGLGALFDCRRASPKANAVGERTANTAGVLPAPGQSGSAPARRSTSSVRVSGPRDAMPTAGEAAFTRTSSLRDVAQAAGEAAFTRASGPRDVTQAVSEVTFTRASGPRDVAQAAGEAAFIRASGPRDVAQVTGEAVSTHVTGPRDVAQPTGETASTRASGPRDVAQAAGEAVSTHVTGPRDVAQAAGEAMSTHVTGPRDVAQAVSEAASARSSGPRDAAHATGEAASARSSGPYDVTQAAGEAAVTHAPGPYGVVQAAGDAASTRASGPHVVAPLASEAAEAEHEEDLEPELAPGASTEATADLPTLDPATLAHFAAIQGALTFREGMLARALAAELSAAELRAWLAELRTLSVPEAVAKIRGVLDPDDSGNISGGVS